MLLSQSGNLSTVYPAFGPVSARPGSSPPQSSEDLDNWWMDDISTSEFYFIFSEMSLQLLDGFSTDVQAPQRMNPDPDESWFYLISSSAISRLKFSLYLVEYPNMPIY